MFSGTVVCIRTPVKDLLVGAMSGMGLSFSELCCLFCCPPRPSRIAAKLAFLPPEPTYAFEEENSTDNAAATTAEPSKCKRSPVETPVHVPPYLRPFDLLCWCCQWRVLCQIVRDAMVHLIARLLAMRQTPVLCPKYPDVFILSRVWGTAIESDKLNLTFSRNYMHV